MGLGGTAVEVGAAGVDVAVAARVGVFSIGCGVGEQPEIRINARKITVRIFAVRNNRALCFQKKSFDGNRPSKLLKVNP